MTGDSYSGFAYTYDMFMDNIPYEDWAKYLLGLLKKYGIEEGIVVDLGCGTGTITEILAKAGYDMIGIDLSEDMLNIALDKKYESELDILYLNQDMREFELYGTVSAIVSICDSMNYMQSEEDMKKVFALAKNYLDQGGYFIFDINTIKKYREIGDSTIAESREDAAFIWENTYIEETHTNRYDLTIFEEGEDGRYDRYDETHIQRAYEIDEIKRMIEETGLEFVAAYEAFTENEASEECERIYVVARENDKKLEA